MMKVIRAKLHGIRVTAADLNYHGSITLDPELCDTAGFYPMEFVEIWNKNSGARISTYVIFGEPGSRCCILNGAAARTCQVGDELIIAASEMLASPKDLYDLKPRILTFLPDNQIDQVLFYDVFHSERRPYDFRIVDAEEHPVECHTWPNVDIAAIRSDLRKRNWSEAEIDAFVKTHISL